MGKKTSKQKGDNTRSHKTTKLIKRSTHKQPINQNPNHLNFDDTNLKKIPELLLNLADGEKTQEMTKSDDTKKVARLSKKNKTILLSVSVSIIFLLVLATVLIIVFAFPSVNLGDPSENTKPFRCEFSYAIDVSDQQGFLIDASWLGTLDYSQITVNAEGAEGAVIDSELKLKLLNEDYARIPGRVRTFQYSYQNKIIAKVIVTTVESALYVASKEDLIAIPENDIHTYIQVSDIDLQGESLQINSFKGKYYANHKKIQNLNVSTTGGLFNSPSGAVIMSLVLENVQAEINYSSDVFYCGTLANKSIDTEVMYCIATGNINLIAEHLEGLVVVGGLVGSAECESRKRNSDIVNEIFGSQTDVKINISGVGNIFVGGVVGVAENVTVKETYSIGAIEVDIFEGASLICLTVGGIAGKLEKVYGPAQNVDALDEANHLYCYSNIKIDVRGGGDGIKIVAGGVYGSIKNHSIKNSSYSAKMYVKSGSCNLRAGGFAGEAQNTTSLPMSLIGVTVNAIIDVKSAGGVYVGGLAGAVKSVDYSDIPKVPVPVIQSYGSPVAGLQVLSEYVALQEN